MTENLIIFNTRVVTPLGFSARCGKEMEQLSIIDNATVEVTDGIITLSSKLSGTYNSALIAAKLYEKREF